VWVILNFIENFRIIHKSGGTTGINYTGDKYAISVNDMATYLQMNMPFINGLNIYQRVVDKRQKSKKWLKCRAVDL
jgi:hypothetical protein